MKNKNTYAILTFSLASAAFLIALLLLGLHTYNCYRYGNLNGLASEIMQDTVVQYHVTVPTDSGQYFNYLQKELSSYRAYIEKEKEEYYSFLTRVYGVTGVVVTLVAILVALLGFNTRENALKQLEELKKEAIQQARLTYQQEVRQAIQGEKAVEILTEIVQREHLWAGANLKVFFSKRSEDANRPLEEILSFFHQRKVKVDETPVVFAEKEGEKKPDIDLSKWDFSNFDMVVYFYDPELQKDEQGKDVPQEDEFLISLVARLENEKVPLIVYTGFAPGALIPPGSKTFMDFKKYPYGTPSNNIITLYANTYDAFNLRLVRQNNPQA